MQTCFSKETNIPTDLEQHMLFFRVKRTMRLPGKESMLMKSPTTINEILDVSTSFLNDHLEETLGSTKIEENHSKCINLAQVSVSS